ncbi:ABC-three component system middle component 7 [Propionimicrobium lymphophilum]|uniref:ABC-three component system middle component 7 n=1 Tax=Propionimicrobium lymphophilum TaxID=33012 RepID=UPI0023F1869C|nr:ABC-three component system middle component 7 [Propionimicrobium lymphophilum]
MKFPSKVVPVERSTFAFFAPILQELNGKSYTPLSLYTKIKQAKRPPLDEYIDALTCLFALGKITLDTETGVLSCAN